MRITVKKKGHCVRTYGTLTFRSTASTAPCGVVHPLVVLSSACCNCRRAISTRATTSMLSCCPHPACTMTTTTAINRTPVSCRDCRVLLSKSYHRRPAGAVIAARRGVHARKAHATGGQQLHVEI